MQKGCDELSRMGYATKVDRTSVLSRQSFFAGSTAERLAALEEAFADSATRAVFCSRGGYGSNYLVDGFNVALASPKILLGSSDITSLQIFLWQRFRWVTFYGPMVASNFDRGAGASHGYDRASLTNALTETKRGWELDLQGESLVPGLAEGILLGGCLTLVEASLGTPWELDTRGALLLLEDRAMKPYQVDRMLMHLKQAGKLSGVRGVILGEFPDGEPAVKGSPEVVDVCRRILGGLGVPVVWGAAVGHTPRPMLTLPLGIRARLRAAGPGRLDFLEPAVLP